MTPEGKERHLAYLRARHPRFVRQAVPRRTPRPDGYASQDDFLTDAHQTLVTFLAVIDSKDTVNQQAAWTLVRLLACGVPTFYLSPSLLEQLADSDVPEDLTLEELFWPHPALCFFLPLKESQAIIGREVPYLLTTTMKTGQESTLRNELLNQNIRIPSRPEGEVDLMLGCFPTARGEVYSWADTRSDKLNQLPLPMRYNPDSKLFVLPSGEIQRIVPTPASQPSADDATVLARARHVALITHLAMTARPDLLEQARLIRPAFTRRKGGELRDYDELWSPNFLRAPVQRAAPGDGTHASPRFHRRRAHFSKYHVGPGRAQSIVRWIEATWVGLKEKPQEGAP